MESKIDRRVQYTKMFLKDALIKLMKEMPISKITTAELCRVANVNRNTFYAHYNTPMDVLEEMEDVLYKDLLSCVSIFTDKGFNLLDLCKAIKDQGETCKVILSENGDRNFLLKIMSTARDMTLKSWMEISNDIKEKDFNMYFNYCANGSVSIIYDWVNDGMKMPYEYVAKILETLNNAVMNDFLKLN